MALNLGSVLPAVTAIGIGAIALGMAGRTLNEIQDMEVFVGEGGGGAIDNATSAYNVSEQGIIAINTMSEFLPTIGIVVIAAVVIGVLLSYFGGQSD